MVTIGVFDPPQQGKGAEALQGTTHPASVVTKDLYHLKLKEVFNEAYIVVRKTPDELDLPTCKISP